MAQTTEEDSAPRVLDVVQGLLNDAHRGARPKAALDSALERDLGLDSLGRVELILRLEREFGVSLPEQALATAETPRDLVRFVRSARPAQPGGASHEVEDLAQGTSAGAPVKAHTLTDAFLWHVERQPERVCMVLLEEGEERRYTYGSLYQSAVRYASALAAAGLTPGQTAAIMLPTCAEYLYSFYGVLLAGGIPVPLYPPVRLSQIEDHLTRHVGILKNAATALLITLPEAKGLAYLLRAQVESLRGIHTPADLELGASGFAPSGFAPSGFAPSGFAPSGFAPSGFAPSGFTPIPARGGDIAFLQYTSGSTGQPKGVVLTHDNLMANVRAMGAAVRATPDDVFVSWLPLYHDMGLIGGCFASLYHGFPVVLMSPLAFLGRPSQWLWAIHRHRGTISGGPNFSFELCLRRTPENELEGLDLGSWRFAFNGAEPVVPETLRAFERRFAPHGLKKNVLSPVYGLAECSVGLAFTPPGEAWSVDLLDRDAFAREGKALRAREDLAEEAKLQVVACGRVIPQHELRVVDAAGFELPDRNEGSLQFRGPSASSGYYRNPEATERLFDHEWLRTGDRAYLADGRLYLTGREKDIIIRGGRNVSPYELEAAVGDLPGIRRGCVAVFGSQDKQSGTEKVVVLAETRATEPEKLEALRRRINDLALVLIGTPADDIVLAPPQSVPKTSSGKIRRAASREFYERGAGAVRPAPVWWQLARLLWAGALPELRRGMRVAFGLAFAARAWLAFALVFPFIFAAALLAPVPFTWRLGHRLARLFFALGGIPLIGRGLENLPRDAPMVMVANHTSYLDAIALVALLDWRHWAFVAKKEFLGAFVMRTLLAGFGTRFVERFGAKESIEDATQLVNAARTGTSLIIFAEGVLNRQTGLGPFRTGAFQVAAHTGLRVAPVAIRGARSVLRDGTWLPRRGTVSVQFGAPVKAEGTDWKASIQLRDRVRSEILTHCGEPDLAAAPMNEEPR